MTTTTRLKLDPLEARDNPSGGFSFTFSRSVRPSIQFVSGTVFADTDGNGRQDAGEFGVNGVRVYADWNNNGVRDEREPSAVTTTGFFSRSANGVTTSGTESGRYFLNAAGTGAPASSAIRVELPAGATQTVAPTTTAGQLSTTGVNVGVTGLVGTPPVVTETPTPPVVVTVAPPTATGPTGGSSSFVFSTASTGPNGSFVSVGGSVSGNGSASGFASAGSPGGTITAVYVG